MNSPRYARLRPVALPCAIALALAVSLAPAWGAGKSALSQAQEDYRQQRTRCLSGESNQPLATCLREAGAAFEETRRGQLDSAPASELARNATQRCAVQPPADQQACMQRILGAGSTEGSVGGGGLIRRTETKVE
jgi:hypothetical protein